MLLRPHHVYCLYFADFADSDRGERFAEAKNKVYGVLKDRKETITISEGPDDLCQVCSHFNGQACFHPGGDEKAVRKWDARILEGLGLEPGQVLSIEQVRSLIKKKAPLNFCLTRCPYYRQNRCNPRALRENLK